MRKTPASLSRCVGNLGHGPRCLSQVPGVLSVVFQSLGRQIYTRHWLHRTANTIHLDDSLVDMQRTLNLLATSVNTLLQIFTAA